MLIKNLFCGPDYNKSLRLRLWLGAAQFAGLFTFVVTVALLFWAVAAPLPAFKLLFGLMLCYGLSFVFARAYLSKKL